MLHVKDGEEESKMRKTPAIFHIAQICAMQKRKSNKNARLLINSGFSIQEKPAESYLLNWILYVVVIKFNFYVEKV